MQIHQVLVNAAPGDAATNDALALRAQIRQVCPSELIANDLAHDGLAAEVFSPHAFAQWRRRPGRDDILIVHVTIGNTRLHKWLLGRPERIFLRYHNVTPSRFFKDVNPDFAALLDDGREQLAELAERAELAIACSAFNATDLIELGMTRVHVVPPLFPSDDFVALRGLPRTSATPYRERPDDYAAGERGPTVLTVGQPLPHKRPDLVLAAFHVLRTHIDPRARLRVVGPTHVAGYPESVRRWADQLRLGVDFMGSVSQTDLVRCYAEADVLVTMSEHEGFCVPIVEAMNAEVPVVARAFGAVPETLGGAGILLDPNDDVCVIAEALHEAATNAELRAELVARGVERAAALDPVRSAEHFLRILADAA